MPVSPGTVRHIAGPWQRKTLVTEDGRLKDRWLPPPGGIGRFELRSLEAQALAIPEGIGFFTLDPADSAPEGYLELGMDINARLAPKVAAEWAAMLDLSPGDLDAPTLADALWWLWTVHGDERVRNGASPVNSRGEVSLGLQGYGDIRREKFSKTEHPAVFAAIRRQYQQVAQRLSPAARIRVLRRLALKTGLSLNEIAMPAGGATKADTFVEDANTAIESHTPTGPNAGDSWTQINGTWRVNGAADLAEQTTVTDPGSVRMNNDLDGDDMTVTVDISGGDFNAGGPICRYQSDAETYLCYSRDNSNSNSHELFSIVAGGTPTQLAVVGSDYAGATIAVTLKVSVDGADLVGLEDDVEKVTYASAALTGNMRSGLYCDEAVGNTAYQYGNFIAADIGGAGPVEVALAGDLPAQTGSLSAIKYSVSLAGAMPAATGALNNTQFATVTGNMPAATGALAAKYLIAVAGSLPAQTGELSLDYLISLAGSLPSPSGALVSKEFAALDGALPAPTGALSALEGLVNINLAGDLPSQSGALDVLYKIALAGNLPAQNGAVNALYLIALTGDLPSQSGAIASLKNIVLTGDLPAQAAALTALYKIALSGDMPFSTGDVTALAFVSLSGELPAMAGALTVGDVELIFQMTPIAGTSSAGGPLAGTSAVTDLAGSSSAGGALTGGSSF